MIRDATFKAYVYPGQEPTPAYSLPAQRPFTRSALRPDHNTRRCSDWLQILSWNPGPARGSDPGTLASHLSGPRHVECVQEAVGFVSNRSLAENFHVITKHAVLLIKDTFDSGHTCTPIQVPSTHRYSSLAEHGRHPQISPPDPGCQYFTVPNMHINNVFAKKAIRGRAPDPSYSYFTVAKHAHQQRVRQTQICLYRPASLGARLMPQAREVVLKGDFKKGAVREPNSPWWL